MARRDRFNRFVSILVYIQKDRYDSAIRQRVGMFLAQTYAGRLSASYPAYPDGPLARTHFIIGRDVGETPDVPRSVLESGVAALVRSWADELRAAAASASSGHPGVTAERYLDAFGPGYRAAYGASTALADIAIIEGSEVGGGRAVRVAPREGSANLASLKLYTRSVPLSLSQRVPILKNFGFEVVDEASFRIAPIGAEPVFLHDMTIRFASNDELDVEALALRLEEALVALGNGESESDNFDALVTVAGLAWRDAALMRGMARYLQQATIRYTQDYMAQALARHPEIAAALVDLFFARFDPDSVETHQREMETRTRRAIAEKMALAVTSSGVTVIRDTGRITGPGVVALSPPPSPPSEAGPTSLAYTDLVIATGCEPVAPPIEGLGDIPTWTTAQGLLSPDLPRRLLVLGGGGRVRAGADLRGVRLPGHADRGRRGAAARRGGLRR